MIQAELHEMDTLSQRLDTCSHEVGDLTRALTTLIGTTTWTGRTADRFRASWESEFNPALRDLAAALVEAGHEVRRTRDRIDLAANY
jgi:WXG100 family type VII secretion target